MTLAFLERPLAIRGCVNLISSLSYRAIIVDPRRRLDSISAERSLHCLARRLAPAELNSFSGPKLSFTFLIYFIDLHISEIRISKT